MTKEKLAYLLNGREYGLEISLEEEKEAEESGLIIIFGYSDDGVVFAGKIDDQFGGWDGKSFRFDKQGNLHDTFLYLSAYVHALTVTNRPFFKERRFIAALFLACCFL